LKRGAIVCGVDEAGRGPLAGPVYAAAVILDPAQPIQGLADSKKLPEARREQLSVKIKSCALAWSIASSSVEEIDAINILQASLLAMRRAVLSLTLTPTEVLVDGNHCPKLPYPVRAVVRGDATVPEISAASILAKVARDALMLEMHRVHPQYGFDAHKGYGTATHMAALAMHGACETHRTTFAPVRKILNKNK
jgi:ribonuclease HII